MYGGYEGSLLDESGVLAFAIQWSDIAVLVGIFLIVSEYVYLRQIRKDIEYNYSKPKSYLGSNKVVGIMGGFLAALMCLIPYAMLRSLGDKVLPILGGSAVVLLVLLAYWYGNMRLGSWYIDQETVKQKILENAAKPKKK